MDPFGLVFMLFGMVLFYVSTYGLGVNPVEGSVVQVSDKSVFWVLLVLSGPGWLGVFLSPIFLMQKIIIVPAMIFQGAGWFLAGKFLGWFSGKFIRMKAGDK